MTPMTIIMGVDIGKEGAKLQPSGFSDSCRFDYYRAGLPGADADEFLGGFMTGADSLYPARVQTFGYDRAHEVRTGDKRRALIRHGGNGGAPLCVEAEGLEAQDLAEHLRRYYGSHYVTNVHSSMDFDDPAVWPAMLDIHCEVHRRWPSVHRSEVGRLFDRAGVSLYQGAPSSDVRTIMYQKGMQKAYQHYGMPDWCRAEARWRPKKGERDFAAKCAPSEVWGASRVSRMIYETLQGVAAPVTVRETPKPTGLESRLASMIRQYGATIAEVRAMCETLEQFERAVTQGVLPEARVVEAKP